jgi:NADPH-dependent 2,4-dienoyl-CoA reductase/sulfur reductase-like enzyme
MLQDLGIELIPRTEARRVLADESVTGVELIEGGSIEAELCLIATGIVPNAELAEAAGLDVAVGITVDDGMHTSDPDVFAVGDVVDHGGRRYGLWPASVEQAQVAVTGDGRREGRLPRRRPARAAEGAGHRSPLDRRRRRAWRRIEDGCRQRVRQAPLPEAGKSGSSTGYLGPRTSSRARRPRRSF